MYEPANGEPRPLCARLVQLLGLVSFVLALAGLFVWASWPQVRAQTEARISGRVITVSGQPKPGAVVRIKASANKTVAGPDGSFVLGDLPPGQLITVTSWADGYYVAWQEVAVPSAAVTLTLKPYSRVDYEDYRWVGSYDPVEGLSCYHCMTAFPEWQAGAHSQSATNPRFFSMYNGTDTSGSAAHGVGYKLDFPETSGNCATCHAPGAATRKQGAFTADMNHLAGAEQEGVFCDFCHKIGGAYLNAATGLPYPNAPGVLSYRLLRTSPEAVLFIGSLDDVTRRVTYLPLEKQSEFCAPCHQFSFWNTPIYGSFREWKESPYPALGIQCQTCHMPTGTLPYFVYPGVSCMVLRDPSTLASHLDLGVKDAQFMQRTVAMTATASLLNSQVLVQVEITNAFAGHHVPTDYPGRNMILVIRVRDAQGQDLELLDGPVIPSWGGQGDHANDYAGMPGKGFAKVLRDAQTGEWPVVSYWKQTRVQSDNRIPAGATDRSFWTFAAPSGGATTVEAVLVHRRLFIDQARAKAWDTEDLEMARSTVTVGP
jgi:hypothetical protein